MTAVYSNSNFFAYNENAQLREYQIEVITFDGDSEIVYVEAYDEHEALDTAASMVDNADYCMIQCVTSA